MKKKWLLLIALPMSLSLAACQNKPSETTKNVETTETSSMKQENTSSGSVETSHSDTLVYGTATLTYSEFYTGDVSSTDSYDAVSSATSSKYSIMKNMATDFVDEATNANGYHITGVQNVNIAVSEAEEEAYLALNPTFVRNESDDIPEQYKLVTITDGKAVYSATNFHVVDIVTDATANLQTKTNWGDYQINVTDGETIHLRNTREDEFDINSEIQGIILETDKGFKVGMEALQSIWVQPYEVSFNVLEDNTYNTHIAQFDNLTELSKLVGETVTKITYIMPDSTYVYEFDGIYIKPVYQDSQITAVISNEEITLSSDDFSLFENANLKVTYTLGSGRERTVYTLLEASLEKEKSVYSLDFAEISALEDQTGVYAALLSSDNYADVTIPIPASEAQKTALEALLEEAKEKLTEDTSNEMLQTHIDEANELLNNETASSSEIGSLFNELKNLTVIEEETKGENKK